MLIPDGGDMDRLYARAQADRRVKTQAQLEARIIAELMDRFQMTRGEALQMLGIEMDVRQRREHETVRPSRPVAVVRIARHR